jgi:hypothetical protein
MKISNSKRLTENAIHTFLLERNNILILNEENFISSHIFCLIQTTVALYGETAVVNYFHKLSNFKKELQE